MDVTEEDESPCSSSSNLFDDIPNDMALQGAFADDKDVAAFAEESGFDAFSGDTFDIIQFVTDNADETPLDSPINGNYYLNNCAMQHQATPLHNYPINSSKCTTSKISTTMGSMA
uniref:Uncharacterized protein n=1 Tax=Ditylenchus dipsaci TaxID=166011 RepID=A0A915EC96_9BILA